MGKKSTKPDLSLMIACIVGGIIGTLLAEQLYTKVTVGWHPVFRVGIYFAMVMLGIGLFGLLSEFITNNLREMRWTGGEKGKALLLLLILTLFFGLLGMLLQFIYGLGYKAKQQTDIKNYIILIDHSGSTDSSDPGDQRFSSVETLVSGLSSDSRILVEVFADEIVGTYQAEQIDDTTKQELHDFFDQASQAGKGGTDVQAALMDALANYTDDGRQAAVLLLSDGESIIDQDTVADAFQARNIPIYAVAFSNMASGGQRVLQQLADNTDGYYYEIDELQNLGNVVKNMVQLTNYRSLLESRRGQDRKNILAKIEHIIFVLMLAALTMVILALVIDVNSIIGKGMLTHIPASLGAALILEQGLQWFGSSFARLLMGILMSVVLVFYTKTEYTEDMFSFGDDGENNVIELKARGNGKINTTRRRRSSNGHTGELRGGGRK